MHQHRRGKRPFPVRQGQHARQVVRADQDGLLIVGRRLGLGLLLGNKRQALHLPFRSKGDLRKQVHPAHLHHLHHGRPEGLGPAKAHEFARHGLQLRGHQGELLGGHGLAHGVCEARIDRVGIPPQQKRHDSPGLVRLILLRRRRARKRKQQRQQPQDRTLHVHPSGVQYTIAAPAASIHCKTAPVVG